jgi:hypothetical protein
VIITVVATGFDESYFTNRKRIEDHNLNDKKDDSDTKKSKAKGSSGSEDKVMSDLDMSLPSNEEDNNAFHDDSPVPNIWAIDDDSSDENKDSKSDDKDETEDHNDDPTPTVVNGIDEEDVEKPSFLRRLSRRRSKDNDSQDHDQD